MSSCLVLYIGVWQHSAATPSALIPTLKLSHLEAIPVPTTLLSNLQILFSSCMLPLQHFQAARILYSSLLHTPTFLASSSILHSFLAKTLVYLSFLPSSLVPATLSSSSLKLCPPPASCRNAGVMRDWATWHDFAEICGKQQLGREITDPRKICWKIRNHQVSTAPWQWPWFILFPHGKQDMVFLFAKVYHVYSGVWTCPWEVTMINFLHVSAQLSLLSSQIIMHHMAGKLVISGITLALSASLPLLCPLPEMGLKGETRTIHRS